MDPQIQAILEMVMGGGGMPNEMTPTYRSNANLMQSSGKQAGKLPMPPFDEGEQAALTEGGKQGYKPMRGVQEEVLEQVMPGEGGGGMENMPPVLQQMVQMIGKLTGTPYAGPMDLESIDAAFAAAKGL